MAQWPTYRTVVLDARAQEFVDSNSSPGSRFDDQWRGIEWLLCRKPDLGLPRHKNVPTKFLLLVVASNEIANTREVWVLYSYDDNNVIVHAIAFGPAQVV